MIRILYMKELKVTAIETGTVIDHVPAEETFNVAAILDFEDIDRIISIATNLPSKRQGKKGILKVGGKSLSKDETDKIAVIAPTATINIIKNYKVVNKYQVKIPKKLNNVVKCFNTNCITNKDVVATRFTVLSSEPLKLMCDYCERVMKRADVKLL